MDWEECLYEWQVYSEVLYKLQEKVTDSLDRPAFWNCNYDDSVFVLNLSNMIHDIQDFVNAHIDILNQRVNIHEEIRANQENAFEAWKRNLCPVLMRNVPRFIKPPDYNIWSTYDEVAAFLNSNRISYSSTAEAIHSWNEAHNSLKISA